VRHRNHLAAMTASTVGLSGIPAVVDFTSASTLAYGFEARKVDSDNGGRMVLWTGNSRNSDNRIKYAGVSNDRDPILVRIGGVVPTNTVTGYWVEDNTLDGIVKYAGSLNDRDPILVNLPGNVTTFRVEQLPENY
jgi:hypothetical protein